MWNLEDENFEAVIGSDDASFVHAMVSETLKNKNFQEMCPDYWIYSKTNPEIHILKDGEDYQVYIEEMDLFFVQDGTDLVACLGEFNS